MNADPEGVTALIVIGAALTLITLGLLYVLYLILHDIWISRKDLWLCAKAVSRFLWKFLTAWKEYL